MAHCTLASALDLMAVDYGEADFDDTLIDLTALAPGATIAADGAAHHPRHALEPGQDPRQPVASERVVVRGNDTFELLTFGGGPSESLEIIGVALRDGAPGQGGALSASGDITLRNVEASSNAAVDGGAISAASWNLRVYDSAFSDNVANGGQGGAIHASSSTLVVERTSFEGNFAQQQGAAIWMQGRLNSAPIVTSSTFRSNAVALARALRSSARAATRSTRTRSSTASPSSTTTRTPGAAVDPTATSSRPTSLRRQRRPGDPGQRRLADPHHDPRERQPVDRGDR